MLVRVIHNVTCVEVLAQLLCGGQASDVDLQAIANKSPPTFTGADYYGFCANALLRAVKRRCLELQETVDARTLCSIDCGDCGPQRNLITFSFTTYVQVICTVARLIVSR